MVLLAEDVELELDEHDDLLFALAPRNEGSLKKANGDLERLTRVGSCGRSPFAFRCGLGEPGEDGDAEEYPLLGSRCRAGEHGLVGESGEGEVRRRLDRGETREPGAHAQRAARERESAAGHDCCRSGAAGCSAPAAGGATGEEHCSHNIHKHTTPTRQKKKRNKTSEFVG